MTKKQPVMDWQAIKAEIHRRGMTLTELSRRAGLHPSVCRKVPTVTHYSAQSAIAEFIDQKPQDLWPDRYPRKRASILDTAKYPPVASQKAALAADGKVAA
ncbi:helix-turn-helix domain-containing protein [Ruixingdingia sedimenti]|uniref:Helix-turn-helix domain-containing protein n=1 Tax=Ruixingdingia sedimenti TaxID=3073604 RepID=A0ABU1FF01_9RHOB|nr:helix-turn-helix domain-containing protein [Xinfangfangia sp. LG-4]MDR5655489.1 helix-turn-helix domain-containing protein [Xinfangfangia sp. LG-4]